MAWIAETVETVLMKSTKKEETRWEAIRRDRGYLPESFTGSREEVVFLLERGLKRLGKNGHVEAMTDQIEVYVDGRKVGIYMP